jgi:hypothetical protein
MEAKGLHKDSVEERESVEIFGKVAFGCRRGREVVIA